MTEVLDRPELILKLIVEQYLADGQPVSSKLLAANTQLGISSATVRNTMMQLEQQGLIRSPHTSAGRIPTTEGMRLFIDKLLQPEPVSPHWMNEIQQKLVPQLPVSLLCQQAGQLLTNLTGFVALISAPKVSGRVVRQLDLVRLSSDRLLLVVIDEDGDILHRVLDADGVDSVLLSKVLCLLNAALAGVQWQDGIERLGNITRNETGLCQTLLRKVLGQLSLDELQQHQPLIFGQHQLLLSAECQHDPALQQMFCLLEHPTALVSLLQQAACDDVTRLILGKESGIAELSHVSVILRRYQQQPHRFIALLGPRRMNYARFIPLIDSCADALNLNLNRQNLSP